MAIIQRLRILEIYMDPENETREEIMKQIRVWNVLRAVYFTFLVLLAIDLMIESFMEWNTTERYREIGVSSLVSSLIFYVFTICVDFFLY